MDAVFWVLLTSFMLLAGSLWYDARAGKRAPNLIQTNAALILGIVFIIFGAAAILAPPKPKARDAGLALLINGPLYIWLSIFMRTKIPISN
jgi:hypothetical protein